MNLKVLTSLTAYKPRPGLDPTFGQQTISVGALMYAYALSEGKTEENAHEYAERRMYEYVYDVKY